VSRLVQFRTGSADQLTTVDANEIVAITPASPFTSLVYVRRISDPFLVNSDSTGAALIWNKALRDAEQDSRMM
jgi:hypothetical protein